MDAACSVSSVCSVVIYVFLLSQRESRPLKRQPLKILLLVLGALFSSIAATACGGQQPAHKQEIDPALVAAVDSLMPRLEVLSGLKKLKPITMKNQSRNELRKYVEQRLKEEMPPAELSGVQGAYAALGLVPDTMNLQQLLLDLYTEQVAGYYDPKTDAFYMVEGTPQDLLRPTLAHELVHALQDQHTNLDSLISRKRGNDRQTAAQAAIEGHATLVMFAILADASGNFDPAMLPDMTQQLASVMEAQNSQFPVFQRAPRIIRETMLFPYVGGAGFVQHIWRTRASPESKYPAPIGALLPQSTEQVLHPATRFGKTPDQPTDVRFAQTARDKVLYENTLGEMEISILLMEHLGTKEAASGWDGDRYRLIEADGRKVLMWMSVWDDAASASRFASAYRAIAAKRTSRAIRVQEHKLGTVNGVWVVDAPAHTDILKYGPVSVELR